MAEKNRGFTLVELLTVIAIIGILSSVILADMSNSRKDAKDAAIIESARSIMVVAERYGIVKTPGDFSKFILGTNGNGNVQAITDCSYDSSLPEADSLTAACQSIFNYTNGAFPNARFPFQVWMGSAKSSPYPKFSIVAKLPGQQKYFCIGSNGSESTATASGLDSANPAGSGCGGDASTDTKTWVCPGCPNDPKGDGM